MGRREFIQTTGAAVAAASALPRAAGADPAGAGRKPNILIVVCDQMNLDAIGAYRQHLDHKAWLCHWVDTPNLDELVANGVSFTESHSSNPVCCPARSSASFPATRSSAMSSPRTRPCCGTTKQRSSPGGNSPGSKKGRRNARHPAGLAPVDAGIDSRGYADPTS